MYIPTEDTQAKLRAIFHEQCMPGACPGPEPVGWTPCNRMAVSVLGRLMPTLSAEMFPAVRADERGRVAERLKAELVCCDLYEAINNAKPEDFGWEERRFYMLLPEVLAEMLGRDWHAICHWGGYASALAATVRQQR